MKIENTKTVTFKDLQGDNTNSFNLTYAENGKAKYITLDTPDEVLSFINENVYDIDYLSINEVSIDIDKLIEKYSK